MALVVARWLLAVVMGVAVWADCASMGRPLPLAPLACTPACLAAGAAGCVGVVLVVAGPAGGRWELWLVALPVGGVVRAVVLGMALVRCTLRRQPVCPLACHRPPAFPLACTLACWPTWRALACPLACRPPASCIQRSQQLLWCNLGDNDAAKQFRKYLRSAAAALVRQQSPADLESKVCHGRSFFLLPLLQVEGVLMEGLLLEGIFVEIILVEMESVLLEGIFEEGLLVECLVDLVDTVCCLESCLTRLTHQSFFESLKSCLQ